MSSLRIKKNYEKVVELLNKNVELAYKELVKKGKRFYEKQVNVGSKKQPLIKTAKVMVYPEYFYDEDTGERIKIERNRFVGLDGVPCDEYLRPLPLYQLSDFKT